MNLLIFNALSWEQRKVSDVAELTTGGTPSTKVKEYWNSQDIPWLSSGEVHKKYIKSTDTMISKAGYENSSARMVPANSVLIALAGQGKTRGTVAVNRIPLATNQSIAAMTFNDEVFPDFVFSNMESRYDELRSISSGDGSRGGLNKQLVGDVIIPCPTIKEQKAIGNFFNDLNHLITLHQSKAESWKNKENQLSTISWEQRKVGELLSERIEQFPKSDEYPLMAFVANEGVAPKGDRYDRSALVNDTEGKLYKRTEFGDFIYSSNNLETGSIGLNKYGNATISPVYSIFRPTGIADSDFIGRRFVRKDFINEMVKWRQGVIYGQWKIHEEDFLKIEVMVPSLEEQRRIGSFLDNLDHLITLHQSELEKLQKIKKSLLERMFV